MGWKSSIIVISNTSTTNEKQTLIDLGFSGLVEINSKTFEEVINPNEKQVYIGSLNNNLIICNQEIPIHFYQNELSKVELSFINKFPNTEIATFVLHSVVNLWGFSIIKNGEKLRVKSGSSDDGTFIEYGNPLVEESEILSFSKKQDDGTRIYRFKNDDEEYTEDQVGENIVFDVSRRYFGLGLDEYDKLHETELRGFKYSTFNVSKQDVKNEKWYRKKLTIYIIIAILFLIYKILKNSN